MPAELIILLPLIVVVGGALACLAGEPFFKAEDRHRVLPWIGGVALLLAALVQYLIQPAGGIIDLHGALALDPARGWLSVAALTTALIGLAGFQHGLSRDRHPGGEAYALILLATCGVLVLIHATDFLAMFIGLELASLSVYGLVGLRRDRDEAVEGLFKYFVMGAVFSALALYGVALTYGATGTTAMSAGALPGREDLAMIGRSLIVIGLLFKVGAVPFHYWSPDAYQGASLAATGFMAGAMKIGGFTALGSVWLGAIAGAGSEGAVAAPSLAEALIVSDAARAALGPLPSVLVAAAIVSVVVGNFSALNQTHLRRLLAFSSVAHAGYMLLAFVLPVAPGAEISLSSLWFYLVGYAVATSAALVIASLLCGDNDSDALTDLHATGRRAPLTAIGMTVLIASLAGFPPTAGFLGKFQILGETVARGQVAASLIAMLGAVVGAIAYLRLTIGIWAGDAGTREPAAARPLLVVAGTIAVVAAVALLAVPELGRSLVAVASDSLAVAP